MVGIRFEKKKLGKIVLRKT